MIPAHLSDYARCVFDQGVGRSIWFATGGNVEQITKIVARFPEARQTNLWAGLGFACAYAGWNIDRPIAETLRKEAGPYKSQLALAGALAAHRRQRVGNQALHTDLACEVFCGLPSQRAAQIAEAALQNLPDDAHGPAYKVWRERIGAHFVAPGEVGVASFQP